MHRQIIIIIIIIIIINWRPISTFIDLCMFDMALELNEVLTFFSATMSPISSASQFGVQKLGSNIVRKKVWRREVENGNKLGEDIITEIWNGVGD